MFMAESLMFTKARKLAPKIVILSDFIRKRYGEKDMTNQLKRSATSIGANLAEAHYAESTADLLHKQKIALKEANETKYWLEVLWKSGYLAEADYKGASGAVEEIIKIVAKSVSTLSKRSS